MMKAETQSKETYYKPNSDEQKQLSDLLDTSSSGITVNVSKERDQEMRWQDSTFSGNEPSSADVVVAAITHSQQYHYNETKAPKPTTEKDYDTPIVQLREMPSLFSDDQHGTDFGCDTTKSAFASYATMAAIEREGLDSEDFPEYSLRTDSRYAGENSKSIMSCADTSSGSHSSPTFSGSITSKSVMAELSRPELDQSRFNSYLSILAPADDNKAKVSLSDAKAYDTMRKLLVSVTTDNDRGKSRNSVCVLNGVSILNHHVLNGENPRILKVAIPVLGCLADQNKERQAILASHSSVVCILCCMRRFDPTKEKLLHEECVIALCAMTQLPEAAMQLAYTVNTGWGIPQLLKTMTALKSSLTAQKHGFGILLHTAQVNHDYVSRSREDVLKVVMAMMNRHTKSAPLLKVGCVLLRQMTLLANEDLFDIMIQEEVIPCLIRTMKSHSEHVALLRHGFGTLSLLCRGNPRLAAKATVDHHKTLVPLLQTVKKHEQNVSVQRGSFTLPQLLSTIPGLLLERCGM
jgi:hypothetical protein